MVISKDNIGDIICEFPTGKRFLVGNVEDRFCYRQEENGWRTCSTERLVEGGVERDLDRVSSFHDNLNLALALDAAELAAVRRLVPGQYDTMEQQEAARVLEIVDEQRQAFHSRLQNEHRTTKAGTALAEQFLVELDGRDSGSTGVFFGLTVKCVRPGSHFQCNGMMSLSKSEANAYLADQTPEQVCRAESIDEKLAKAFDRIPANPCVSSKLMLQRD